MGKKVKKFVKKVTKVASKVPGSGFSDSSGNDKAPDPVEAPETQVLQTPPAKEEDATADENKDTESARKAAKRGGKGGLSVARSGGSGLNI